MQEDEEMISSLRAVSVHRVGGMLWSIELECRGWEGNQGFPKRNRKWTCGEASGVVERRGFRLETYRGTVWAVLQPKKPLRESLQANTFSAKILWKVEMCFFFFLNNLLENKTPSGVLGHVQLEEKMTIIPSAGSGQPEVYL